MRRISESAFAELYFWGCNPGFIVTDEGVVMIDTPPSSRSTRCAGVSGCKSRVRSAT